MAGAQEDKRGGVKRAVSDETRAITSGEAPFPRILPGKQSLSSSCSNLQKSE